MLAINGITHEVQETNLGGRIRGQSWSELDPNGSSTPSDAALSNCHGASQSSSASNINGLVYRARKKYDAKGNNINRVGYNSISRHSASRFSLIMRHLETKDWKMIDRKSIDGEDIAFVVSPHHHLVDDAWRSVRSFATSKQLKAGREKLTELERSNIVPKFKRKIAFLVVVANSKNTLKKVMAAERTRLGFVGLESDSSGLVLEGTPLCPSPQPIRFSADDPNPGPVPTNTIGESSPMLTGIKVQNLPDDATSSSSSSSRSSSSQVESGLQAELDAANSLLSRSSLLSVRRKIGAIPTDRVTRGRREPSHNADQEN